MKKVKKIIWAVFILSLLLLSTFTNVQSKQFNKDSTTSKLTTEPDNNDNQPPEITKCYYNWRPPRGICIIVEVFDPDGNGVRAAYVNSPFDDDTVWSRFKTLDEDNKATFIFMTDPFTLSPKCRAQDNPGAYSDWKEPTTRVSKEKTIVDNFFLSLFENYPNMFTLFQRFLKI